MKSEFKKLNSLVARNIKLYFKDKMVFFVSLITPMILIVLFLTFLGKTYESSLFQMLPKDFEVSKHIVKGFTGGWLFSSILATSCITVAFCSNMLVTDKLNKATDDFRITPVKPSTLQISYFISNFITTFIVCFAAFVIGIIYLAAVGWYLTFLDLVLILINMVLTILIGTLLAGIVGIFLKSQGALSAVCTLVSSMYGFLCGAYMPISQFSPAIQKLVGFVPGTYSTILFRQYYMNGVLKELSKTVPAENLAAIKAGFDSFFGHDVPTWAMYVVLIGTTVALFGIYILCTYLKSKNKKMRKLKPIKSK